MTIKRYNEGDPIRQTQSRTQENIMAGQMLLISEDTENGLRIIQLLEELIFNWDQEGGMNCRHLH